MRKFSVLCQQLESVPFHRDKTGILADYLRTASYEDGSWALYLLLGGQVPRVLRPDELERWILEESQLPAWLLQECRENAGDLGETVALLAELTLPDAASTGGGTDPGDAASAPGAEPQELSLTTWIESKLHALIQAPPSTLESTVRGWWRRHPADVCWVAHALALGRFPVRVSRRIADDAVEATDSVSLTQRLAPLAAQQPAPARGTDSQLDLFR